MTLARLGDVVGKVRSKNAGPFWLTIDLFCEDAVTFQTVVEGLSTTQGAIDDRDMHGASWAALLADVEI